jgi:hypothetical protein
LSDVGLFANTIHVVMTAATIHATHAAVATFVRLVSGSEVSYSTRITSTVGGQRVPSVGF